MKTDNSLRLAGSPDPRPSHVPEKKPVTTWKSEKVDVLRRFSVLGILVIIAAAGSFLSPGFLEPKNLATMTWAISPIAIVAVATTFVLIAGGIDVSVGSNFVAGGVVFAWMSNASGSIIVALLAALVLGTATGGINGALITGLKLNPFITTLGTGAVLLGVMRILTDNSAIYATHPDFMILGSERLLGFPLVTWILLVVLAVAGYALTWTKYGRLIFAVGDSPEACRLMGIPVTGLLVSTYCLSGAAAAFAGVLFASQSGVGLTTVGADIPLLAIAMVVVGGTSLFGGRGSMWRTAVGILIFAMITSLFTALAFDGAVQSVVQGGVIVAALLLDRFQNN